MKLIGMLDSPYVRRVAISAKRLGIDLEHESVSVFRHFEQFQQINPVVKAPTLILDDGVVLMDSTLILDYLEASSGKSLLPAGVRSVSGAFHRGDTVSIVTTEGREIARGLAGYDADEARRICGRKSNEIEKILGYAGRAAMIHRDDLVITELGQRDAAAADRKDAAHA